MSARINPHACPKGIRYRNEQQALKARDRSRAQGKVLGWPEWLLPAEWFRHPACGGWHLCRDNAVPRDTIRTTR